jgi:tetratricopeptide (TPR) repeat protein
MLDQEEIGQQQKLLETHRRTLSHYIRQQAALGFLAPPGVTHGMHEVREEIRRIKATLRERDIAVEDHPDDKPHVLPSGRSNSVAALLAGVFALVGGVASVAALVQLARYDSDPFTITIPATVVGLVWIGCVFVAFRSASYFFYAWAGAIGVPLFSAMVLGLARLLQYEYDALTYVLLAIGVGGGILICVYLAITSKESRRLALSGLIIVTLLGFGGLDYIHYDHTRFTDKFVILVANFDGPDSDYAVTETILGNLRETLKQYDNVKVVALGRTITEQAGGHDYALAEGKNRKAAIVIWGWYKKTDLAVSVNATFEILESTKYLADLKIDSGHLNRIVPIGELNAFTLQTCLSNKMTYLTLITLGIVLFSESKWRDAIGVFSGALNDTNKNDTNKCDLGTSISEAYYYRGSAYTIYGNNDLALDDFNQAIHIQPDFANAYFGRGIIHFIKGNYNAALTDYDQAIDRYNRSLYANPEDIRLQTYIANAYINRGIIYDVQTDHNSAFTDYDRAIDIYNRFIEQNSDNIEAYTGRGLAYSLKADYDRAIIDINRAVALKTDNAMMYYDRGVIFYTKGEYNQVIADCTKAINLKLNTAEVYFLRGMSYSDKGDFDHAIADLSRAISLKPGDAEALYLRGRAYAQKKDYKRAIDDFSESMKNNPKFEAVIYVLRGAAYAQEDDYTHALKDLNQAVKLNQNDANAYNTRGLIYATIGDKDRAITDYNQAIKLQPDYALAYKNRGVAYFDKGNYDQALADFDRAIDLNLETADIHFKRGVVYGIVGTYDRAIIDFDRAIEINPAYAEAYYDRGLAYEAKQDKEKAILDFQRVLELSTDPDLRKQAQDKLKLLGAQ